MRSVSLELLRKATLDLAAFDRLPLGMTAIKNAILIEINRLFDWFISLDMREFFQLL